MAGFNYYPEASYGGRIPMTLAVALIGSDGWVLASDTRLYKIGNSMQPNGVLDFGFVTASTPKIHINQKLRVVYTFAGDHVGQLAGEILINNLKTNKEAGKATLLKETGASCFEQHVDGTPLNPNLSRQLLVVFFEGPIQVWSLDIGRAAAPAQHKDQAIIGDITNGAKIFPQLYHAYQSVEILKVMAAHTILMGHECNATMVAGLEICWGNNDGSNLHEATLEERRALAQRSREIDEQISELFKTDRHLSRSHQNLA
jgi:hypothetical protein